MNHKIRFVIFIALLIVHFVGFHSQAAAQSPCYTVNNLFGIRITESGVYLFAQPGFAGCGYRFTSDEQDLANTLVGNDTVSSIIIVGDYAATLYQNKNYRGNASTFVKSQRNIKSSFIGEDRASSLQIRKGDCNDEPGVYLYENSNFKGRCTKFMEDAASLRILYIQPNTSSSIKIIGDWEAIVYTGENFTGSASRFDGNDANFGDNTIGHDHARSIQVTPQHRVCDGYPGVYLYANKNYLGTCSRFTSSVGDLSAHRIGDNTASSIRLVDRYQATLYSDKRFGGSNSPFTTSDPDLGNDWVGEDRASSILVIGPNPEQSSVYRLQIQIETGNVNDAGTDDDILVSLNQYNFTWLDYGRNDFERRDKFTYDLLLERIGNISDIKWVTFSKTGSDGWCLKGFSLIVNNQTPPANHVKPVIIFQKEFTSCQWLDNDGEDNRSLVIPFSELRAQTKWRQARIPGPSLFMDSSEITSRIESTVGNALHYFSRVSWGESHGKSVEIKGFDITQQGPHDHRADRIHVDLDLAGDASVTDVEVDIDFDLLIRCIQSRGNTSQIKIQTANARFHVNWFVSLFYFLIPKINNTFRPSMTLDTGLELCPNIVVDDNGSVSIR